MKDSMIDSTRGERMSVECPDCDRWVVLAPAERAKDSAIHAMNVTYPGAMEAIESFKVFAGNCECGSTITVTATRNVGGKPRAEA